MYLFSDQKSQNLMRQAGSFNLVTRVAKSNNSNFIFYLKIENCVIPLFNVAIKLMMAEAFNPMRLRTIKIYSFFASDTLL